MQGVPNSWGKGGDLDSSWVLLLLSLLQYWGHRAVKDLGSWANWRPLPGHSSSAMRQPEAEAATICQVVGDGLYQQFSTCGSCLLLGGHR